MKSFCDNKNKRLKLAKQVTVSTFFKSAEKNNEVNTSAKPFVSTQKINEAVNYVSDCPLFASLNDPRFKYDIGPILEPRAKITLTEGAKFQMLTSQDYLPSSFKFPPNNDSPSRQCSHEILNLYDFLRYSPSLDAVLCIYCVLFTTSPASVQLQSAPARAGKMCALLRKSTLLSPLKKEQNISCVLLGLRDSYVYFRATKSLLFINYRKKKGLKLLITGMSSSKL